ncbi:MAG: GNAT family N-acetyltransferase [Rhodobacteraceae bacterium]|nr:GNAT family N-acetyltransferase [Paracoccaceae bacterium]
MSLTFSALTGAAILPHLPALAGLRIAVFREWPYLYEGDADYERGYLAPLATTPGAVVVAARDGARMVGAATGAPMTGHAAEFAAAFAGTGLDLSEIFYCAESVLLPEWRGQGAGHRFFDLREAQARSLGLSRVAFCAVIRPEDHPARPPGYRPLDPFWRARGYAPLPGVVAHFAWRDIGAGQETEKPLQFWMRDL